MKKPAGEINRCPRCGSREWYCIDKFNHLKVNRCLDCRRKYTIDYNKGIVIARDFLNPRSDKTFRAKCPKCQSYRYAYIKNCDYEGMRDYQCAICRKWYRADFKRKRIKALE